MTEQISSSLSEIIACKSPKEASERFSKLLKCLSELNNEDLISNITTIVNSISQDMVTVISARKFCDELINFVTHLPENDVAILAFQILLARMQSRNIAFESQLVELRDCLSKRFEAVRNLREAAVVLSEIPLESGQRVYSANYKSDIYLRIAEYYLKLHEITEAEAFVNRASLLQPECQDPQLVARYKIAYAHLLDLKQKFLEAGQRYAELSVRFPWLNDTERLGFLERSVAAALLSGAGHQRARLLATLYKDERCQGFEAYPILENMFLGRLINRSSLCCLEPLLTKYYPHLLQSPTSIPVSSPATTTSSQLEVDKSKISSINKEPKKKSSTPQTTIYSSVEKLLERALIEHNMLAASLIYDNISLDNLGCLLEISPTEAESIASQMISEGRLVGQLDQIDGVIRFESCDQAVSSWTTQIQSLCIAVNRIVEDIESAHPEWVHTQLSSRMVIDPPI